MQRGVQGEGSPALLLSQRSKGRGQCSLLQSGPFFTWWVFRLVGSTILVLPTLQ